MPVPSMRAVCMGSGCEHPVPFPVAAAAKRGRDLPQRGPEPLPVTRFGLEATNLTWTQTLGAHHPSEVEDLLWGVEPVPPPSFCLLALCDHPRTAAGTSSGAAFDRPSRNSRGQTNSASSGFEPPAGWARMRVSAQAAESRLMAVLLFPGFNPHRQSILFRGQGTCGVRSEGARRVVGFVEI